MQIKSPDIKSGFLVSLNRKSFYRLVYLEINIIGPFHLPLTYICIKQIYSDVIPGTF